MLRTLLITAASRKDGRVSGTYGAKIIGSRMKFPFIISVVGVVLWCNFVQADTRFIDHINYLEYLNDFDRRNADLNDANIHTQWPFQSISHNGNGDEQRELEEKIFNELKTKYPGALLDPDRKKPPFKSEQLTQYTRYKPFDVENAEERFNEDVNIGSNENEDGEEFIHTKVPRPVFPRIANVDRPINYGHFDFNLDEPERENEEEEEEIVVKPTFSTYYFPRLVPADVPGNYPIYEYETEWDKLMHDNKGGEEHDIYPAIYSDAPVAEDPSEFGIKPSDPRFYSDNDQTGIAEDPSEFGVKPSDPRFYSDNDQTEELLVTTPQVARSENRVVKMKKPETSGDDTQNQLQEDFDQDLQFDSAGKDVEVVPFKPDTESDSTGVYIIAIVAGISAAATVGLIAVAIGWYNLQKHMKNAEDTDYPSYGIVGPNKDYEKKERDDAGDRRLAQSAQMYHYQHQKQQIIAMGRNPQGHGSQSDSDEEEDEEGNYTVYECPGLASIEGPLEVKNPMFDDDQLATPSQTPLKPTKANDTK